MFNYGLTGFLVARYTEEPLRLLSNLVWSRLN